MIEDINISSGDNQNVLFNMFDKDNKIDLLNNLCVNLCNLDQGEVYNNLCKKLKILFDDQTNGTKYFNNLVNILEILDYAQKNYSGFDCQYFEMFWKKFTSNDKISEFINLVKNFGATDSEYMFVVKDANGNDFKTPGLQITTAQVLFDNNEIIIASDINNTCKTGSTIQNQFKQWVLNPYFDSDQNYLERLEKNELTANDKLNRDIFGVSKAIGFLLAWKEIKDHNEWENEIQKTYGLTLRDLNKLVAEVEGCNIYNTARLLSKPEDDKILFYNVPIRGKGSGDFNNIDSEEFELFSMFDKNSMFKLDRYHIGKGDSRVSYCNKYGANFLLDQVGYGTNLCQEGYAANTSYLTDLGKNVTKTGLKWFLDEKKYDIVTDKCGIITVKNKKVQEEHVEEDINIINTNNSLEEKEISDQTVFNQISKFENSIDKEIESYTDNFISDVKDLLGIYFYQSRAFQNIETNTGNNVYDNKIIVNRKIDGEVGQFISSLCEVYNDELLKFFGCSMKMQDKCNFKYLLKNVIGPVITDYFKNLNDQYKEDLALGKKSIVETIKDKFQNELLKVDNIRDKLVREIYYMENGWLHPMKYDKEKNKFLEDTFKFNFDTAGLKAHETAKLLNESFSQFKKNMSSVYNSVLPDNKEEFEKSFEDVDCAEFITFLKQNMHIDVNKEFLKRAISAMFYTWVESVHGNEDNGDSKMIAARLTEMRKTFFEYYSGTKFIHEVKLYTSNMIDKGEKPLPDAFYWYNSDVMKIGTNETIAYRFTVVNYIQAFYYATLAIKRKKCKNMSWWSHRRFNKNIEETRRILQTGTEPECDQIFHRMRQIRDQKYQDNIWGLPLAFLDILLNGVSIDLSLEEKIEICAFARNYVDHELDNTTKDHVTKSNFMEIDKKNNCYLKSGGQIVLPLTNLFAPGAIDEFLSKIICDQVWKMSFCNTCCDAITDLWHYFNQSDIFIKLLAKALFILLFTCFSLIIGIVLLIAYIVYTKNLKSKLNDDICQKLRQAENKGRKEYHRLQNFKQNMKRKKPPKIIETGEQKTNLNIDMNRKFNIINDLKINNGNNVNSSINNNIINTNSNQINDLFNNY